MNPSLRDAGASFVQQPNEYGVRRFALNAFIRLGRLHETWNAIAPGTGHDALAKQWWDRRDSFAKPSSSSASQTEPE